MKITPDDIASGVVIMCDGCGCLVVNSDLHTSKCAARPNAPEDVVETGVRVPRGGSGHTFPEYGIIYDEGEDEVYRTLADLKSNYEENLIAAAEDPEEYAGMRMVVRQKSVILGPWEPVRFTSILKEG